MRQITLILLTLLTGYAPAAGATGHPSTPAVTGSHPCLPPGVSRDFFQWPVVAAQPGVSPRGDRLVPAMRVRYQDGPHAVEAVWASSTLIMLDLEPDNPATPVWYDVGLVDPETMELRPAPGSSCQWTHPTPTLPGT